ncbi:MAG: GNAT family N-acetyltransferase [Candidatus Magasanikbacteria bacterium]|nr:GNAT family N-acetyltransferase [Candidatus Magasanikbacteria bacterium]
MAFNNLTLREQGWFLWYVQQAATEGKERARAFIERYGENGFKTFLSLEHDRESGGKILDIGEKLSPVLAEEIFEKYGELVEAAMNAGEYLSKKFPRGDGEDSRALETNVADQLLRRGKDLLVQIATMAGEEKNGEAIKNRLSRMKKDVVLFASAFKIYAQPGRVDFDKISGVEIATEQSEDLDGNEIEEMRSIFAANRSGEDFTRQFLAAQLKKFDKIVESAGRKFYMLKNDGRIVSFARFDERDDGKLYFGFFNTESEVRGHGIGGAFMQAILEREARDKDVVLDVRVDNPAAKSYERDFGFKIEKTFVDGKNGATYYRMTRPPGRRASALAA